MVSPHRAPSAAARPTDGLAARRYPASSVNAMRTADGASLITTASFIQRFGFTAATAAAARPSRAPPTRRPRSPMAPTATVPITDIVRRKASVLSPKTLAVGASRIGVSGG
jgi:hypothetical protein